MTILVTGGAGFIGSHLVEQLLKRGDEVVCLDSFDPFYDPAIKRRNIEWATGQKGFTLVEGDIRDRAAISRALTQGIDVVVHLAARAGVRPSIEDPVTYNDVNVAGTLTLLEGMHLAGVSKLVFGSSSSVYGNNTKVPFAEVDSVDHPISPYAATKKAGELLCHTYHHLHGMNVYCLRFFTVYGPRQRPDMAIHQFMRKVMIGEPITLFGDGSSQRDYTFVDDIVAGVTVATDHVQGYEIINIGGALTIGLHELIQQIEKVTSTRAIIDWKPMQAGDVLITSADIQKARQLLGFTPRINIQLGLVKMYEWLVSGQGARN